MNNSELEELYNNVRIVVNGLDDILKEELEINIRNSSQILSRNSISGISIPRDLCNLELREIIVDVYNKATNISSADITRYIQFLFGLESDLYAGNSWKSKSGIWI